MSEQVERKERDGTQRWAFLRRLVLVLAAVVAVVLLAKRAIALDRQLQAVLDAETVALNRGDRKAFSALQDPDDPLFFRAQRSSFDAFQSARTRREAVAQPTLYVVEVERWGEEAWALVMEDPDGDPAVGPARIAFFRREYGQWLHTGPDPDHWGPEQESRTEHVTWHYRETDAEQVAHLAGLAESVIERVRSDVGLELEANALAINVCYSPECGQAIFYPLDDVLDLPTPLLSGLGEDDMDSLLAYTLADYLIGRATELERGVASLRLATPLLNGVEHWEVVQVMGEAASRDPLSALRQAVDSGTLLGLHDLDDPTQAENTTLRYGEAYTLVEYLVNRYGRQVLPGLVQAAGHHVSVVESLQEALGPDVDLAALEVDWLDFIRERYGT